MIKDFSTYNQLVRTIRTRALSQIFWNTLYNAETSSGHDGSGLARLSARRERGDMSGRYFGVEARKSVSVVPLRPPPGGRGRKGRGGKGGSFTTPCFGAHRRLVVAAWRRHWAARHWAKKDERIPGPKDIPVAY